MVHGLVILIIVIKVTFDSNHVQTQNYIRTSIVLEREKSVQWLVVHYSRKRR